MFDLELSDLFAIADSIGSKYAEPDTETESAIADSRAEIKKVAEEIGMLYDPECDCYLD